MVRQHLVKPRSVEQRLGQRSCLNQESSLTDAQTHLKRGGVSSHCVERWSLAYERIYTRASCSEGGEI